MSATIHYLYHSGFAVDTGAHFLIFDQWRNAPTGAGLEGGVINPASLRDRDVIAFASHAHPDHFNRAILGWGKDIPHYRLILSDDIPPAEGARMIGPGQRLEEPDLTVKTLLSTDQGVAFLVEIDGLAIYHAGDLNWWHWEGEPDPWNPDVARNYKAEIDRMKGSGLDIAFVPVDPRLGDACFLGIDYLMRTVGARHVVPMHFGNNSDVVDRLLLRPESAEYRG